MMRTFRDLPSRLFSQEPDVQPSSRRFDGRYAPSTLNFSSGTSDATTLTAWNKVYFAATQGDPLSGPAPWLVVRDWLTDTLAALSKDQAAFRDCAQATRVISLLWSELLPDYLDFHRDLLFHQNPEVIFNGFFMARAADAILTVGIDGKDTQVVQNAIDHLDDFVGYRPVAVLENRNCQPYRHEFVRPVPLYVQGAGVASGPYHGIISHAIDRNSRRHRSRRLAGRIV